MSEGSNRTILAGRLANGNATQKERDTALAELLLSMLDADTLNEHIDKRIDDHCAMCKAKNTWQPVVVELIHCKLFWVFLILALIIGGSSLIQSVVPALFKLF